MLTITFLSPLIGKGTDKFGSRIVLIIGTTVLGLGFCLLRFMQEPWHLYCLCMLFYTGFSATSMATMSSLLGRWFFNRRGLAIGIAYTGVGFGGVIFHEACGHLLETTSVAKKASVFHDKMGELIANPVVNAVDDGIVLQKILPEPPARVVCHVVL